MGINNLEFWDATYRNNAPILLGVLRRYVKETNIAQDLLHEVFITAIDKYDNYTGKGSFEGWLYRIAVNTALMYLRSEQHKQVVTNVETWQTVSLSVMKDNEESKEQNNDTKSAIETAGFSSEELLNAIDRLPEHHKLVFNMYVMDDFSHKQIAAELNISPGTSKSHLARARKKIQQFLYNDALNRKRNKDRRWVSAFALLFPINKHYIDELYRNGLSNFALTPTGGVEFLATALEQHATASVLSAASATVSPIASVASQTISTAAFWGSKLLYIAVSCCAAAITGTVCWMLMSDGSSSNEDINTTNSTTAVCDSVMYLSDLIKGKIDNGFDADIYYGKDSTNYDRNAVKSNRNLNYDSRGPVRHISTDSMPSSEKMDSTSSAEKTDSTLSAGQTYLTPSAETTTDPIIIKKQIIQHQTVVVRDTIYIIE
jgi:RNA polymerase sigma factor (sigma-70 family)